MRTVHLPCLALVVALGSALITAPVKADGGYGHEWNHGYSNHGSWNHHSWEHRDGWGPGTFFASPPVYSPPPVFYSGPPQITPITPPPAVYGPPSYYSSPPQITPLTPPPTFYGPPVSSFMAVP